MNQDTRQHLLHVENVHKQYGDKMVLDDIDLSVREGEFCTVVGPSGCGKSTLLRLVLGMEQPSSGSLLIDGEKVGVPDKSRGIVFQRYSLFPHLTVLENVLLGKKLSSGHLEWRSRRAEYTEMAMDYLSRVRLEKAAHKYPHELSGGMQQRVAIAQAIIMHPRILLMDEPFGALDPTTREELQMFILELWESTGMTIFFVTHDLPEALYLGSRLFLLSQYYTDDRGSGDGVNRGARIVADYKLNSSIAAPSAKVSRDFVEMEEEIRRLGFDPNYQQHISEFTLSHPDSFMTLEKHIHARGE